MIFSTKFNVKIEYIGFFRVRVLTNFLKVKKVQFLATKEISWQITCRFQFSPYDIDTLKFNFLAEYSFF